MEHYLDFAEDIAAHFLRRGEPEDDIVQVARVGLIEAVDRFDPSRGVRFEVFAAATIRGVIKRHFRDHAWLVHVPRPLKQAHLAVRAGQAELTQVLGRPPQTGELAAHLGVQEADVTRCLGLATAYVPLSLDVASRDRDDGGDVSTLAELIPGGADDQDRAEARAMLHPLVARLSSQERRLVFLRFYTDRTQTEIARHAGMSQTNVCRQLGEALRKLRTACAGAGPQPGRDTGVVPKSA